MAEDAELAEDLVGVTSARLLAAGVPRPDRNGAMRLLGVLATLADREQRVRRPLPDVASEFDLPPAEVESWAGHLEAAGAIRREGPQVVLLGAEPPYAGGLRLHDFLDAAAELDRPPTRRETRDLVRPLGAVLVAAALLVAVLAAPGVLRQDATPVSSERDGTPAVTQPDSGPSGTPGTTGGGTATDPPAGGGSTPTTDDPGDGPTVQPSTPGATPDAPTTTTLFPLPECPTGLPTIEVLDSSTDLSGNLAVSGLLRNPTDTPMTVESFTVQVTVLGQVFAVPGSTGPIDVPPHGTAPWQTSLGVAAPPGTPVTTDLGVWSWNDPGLPSRCTAP
jgi:hypothetical protein